LRLSPGQNRLGPWSVQEFWLARHPTGGRGPALRPAAREHPGRDSPRPSQHGGLDRGHEQCSAIGPAEDKFVSTYLFTRLKLSIAEGVSAELPIDRDAVELALAELRQNEGNLDGAIDVVEQLEPSTYAAVSLAELYAQTGRWDNVIQLTEGVRNEDDAAALLCVFRGQAFREQGFHEAAHEALKEALRSRSRASEIRHRAFAERAPNFLAQGKKSQARKDLERILADDSSYEGSANSWPRSTAERATPSLPVRTPTGR
jgi:tetratricopeptide (TPR) repeat protein